MEPEEQFSSDLTDQAFQLIIPSESELRNFRTSGQVLVHYTSFNNAKNILKKPELWLRNARLMPGDPSEINLGRDCVDRFLDERATEFSGALNAISANLWQDVRNYWNAEESAQIDQTYLASFTSATAGDFSGHKRHWEEYGPVAFHLNPAFLQDEPWKLAIYAVKVTYGTGSAEKGLLELVNTLRRYRDILTQVPHDTLVSLLRHRLFFASVGSKKPEFAWEDEWRFVHSPFLFSSANVSDQIFGDGATAQRIYCLPFHNTADGKSPFLAASNLIVNVVIRSPDQDLALETRDALIAQLVYHGMNDAAKRVHLFPPSPISPAAPPFKR